MQSLDELIKNDKVKFRNYIENAGRNKRGIDDSFFAESLSGLIRKADPADFFNRTEVVPSLREFLEDALRRVSAMSDEPAFMLDTVMGGGKTHAMAYLYFMLNEKVVAINQEDIINMLRRVGRNTMPDADVIAIDGNDLDSRLGLNEQAQLRPFFESGENRQSVKSEISRRGKPVVFIMDEMLDYFVKRKDGFDADLAYLKTLVEGVADTENSAVVISVPSDFSSRAKYDSLKNLFSSMHRRATIIQPVKGSEDLYAIIRKQLLEKVDQATVKEAAKYATKVYGREGITPDERNFESAFPFHPELLEIMSTRLASFENFQKTRESLKLLATISVDIIRRVNSGEKFSTPFITPGDVDLESIKAKITSSNIFDIKNLEIVVDRDILTLKGLDRKLATVVYLYSLFNDQKRAGADRILVYKALLLENISPMDIEEKLKSYTEKQASYFDYNIETKKFYTNGKPTVFALINRKKQDIGDPSAELIKHIENMLKYNSSEVFIITTKQEPAEGKLNIAIYPPRDFGEPEKLADDWQLFSGKNRNGVVLLYPVDKQIFYTLIDEGKRTLAIEMLKKEFTDKETKVKLDIESKNSDDIVGMLIMKTYRGLYWLGAGYKKKEINAVTNDRDYRNAILNELADDEKAYTAVSIDRLNLKEYFDRLLGQRVNYNKTEAYNDVQESTTIPFLTLEAFNSALKKVDSHIIAVIDDTGSNTGGGVVITRPEPPIKEPAAVHTTATQPLERLEKEGKHQEIDEFLRDLQSVQAFSTGDFAVEFMIVGEGTLSFKVKSNELPKLRTLVDDIHKLLGDSVTMKASTELSREQTETFKLLGKPGVEY